HGVELCFGSSFGYGCHDCGAVAEAIDVVWRLALCGDLDAARDAIDMWMRRVDAAVDYGHAHAAAREPVERHFLAPPAASRTASSMITCSDISIKATRWVMTMVVRPRIRSASFLDSSASVSGSSAAVGSSSTSTDGRRSSARAMAMRCRSPAESARPR